MQKHPVRKVVLAAVMGALTCAATMAIRIPTPGTGGYLHPGDALVILCGVVLGPVGGALAAGIGSALADLAAGAPLYIPITLVLKGIIAFAAGLLYQKFSGTKGTLAVALGGVVDTLVVTGGYLLWDLMLYGVGAVASIPSNLIQGISGLVLSVVLYRALLAVPDFRKLLS
ncbi:MAG: ECF transporter S component [Acutalibacter sp.]